MRETETETSSPVTLLHVRPHSSPHLFHPVVDGFVDSEISPALLQNELRLTDYTDVFCLNSRPYSGTSSFYCITVSSPTKKRIRMYTNRVNWLTELVMTFDN